MNAYLPWLVLTTASVAVSSDAIQIYDIQLQQTDKQSNHRRYLLEESTCTLFRKYVEYGPTEDHPKGYHEESWICELSKDDANSLNVQFLDVVESSAVAAISNATSGESTLTIDKAIVEKSRMYVPDDAYVEVRNISGEKTRNTKKGPETTGTLKVLVVRLIDRNKVAPDARFGQMYQDFFCDTGVCLKTQIGACSHDKLKIEPFSGITPSNRNVKNGIVNVKMDIDITDEDASLTQAAHSAANKQLGDLIDPMFDLIIFCFPPGRYDFRAFAYANHKYTFYNNKWCGAVAAQMHEIGHNLGLGHSGGLLDPYGDGTGLMGINPGTRDVEICFNPQKNYQLGWYGDKAKTINPLDGTSRREFKLQSVSDYKKGGGDVLVVLRLEQMSNEQDYYVGFNRATGITKDTIEDKGKLIIVRKDKGSPEEYGQSTKVAALIPGQRHVIENFDGVRNIQVVFIGLKNAKAKILVVDNDELLPTPAPEICQTFTIELNTDRHPQQNQWYITDTVGWGEAIAFSPLYTEKRKKYLDEVCLPMGADPKTYKFSFLDDYGDGICCQHGNGSYKAYNEKGQMIFSGGESFSAEYHFIQVPGVSDIPSSDPSAFPSERPSFDPSTAPSASPSVFCTDNSDFLFKGLTGKNCQWVVKLNTFKRCKIKVILANCRATCDPECNRRQRRK
jgi:hypothetical protein